MSRWNDIVEAIGTRISKLPAALPERKYDVIISVCLFDYLNTGSAQKLLALLDSRLEADGQLAITNYHKADPSAFTKEWVGDWKLIYRDLSEVETLYPPTIKVAVEMDNCGTLVLATGTRE